jgi:hypothetical protein
MICFYIGTYIYQSNVWLIRFFVFRFMVKVTKKTKNGMNSTKDLDKQTYFCEYKSGFVDSLFDFMNFLYYSWTFW